MLRESSTPLPNYVLMLTPELKRQLASIGVKPIPRRKAVALLSHIYEQTHPTCGTPSASAGGTESEEAGIMTKVRSQRAGARGEATPGEDCAVRARPPGEDCAGRGRPPAEDCGDRPGGDGDGSESSDSEDSAAARLEAAFSRLSDDDDDEITASQAVSGGDLAPAMATLLRSRPDLQHQILTYEPVWLERLHADLRQAGVKVKVSQLMDYLDEQCVTFRTEASGKRRKSPKKKRSPKKTARKKQSPSKNPTRKKNERQRRPV